MKTSGALRCGAVELGALTNSRTDFNFFSGGYMTFNEFMKLRLKASNDFVNGSCDELRKISTENDPATIFPPPGTHIKGAQNVNEFNLKGAARFERGSENNFEVFHQAESGDLAYWTGLQHSVVRMKGEAQPVTMHLRITEIFRKERDAWKLIHRHADESKNGEHRL